MAQLDLINHVNVENVPDLVHRVRRLQFFTEHLSHGISSIGKDEALTARFDQKKATHVFLEWVQHVNQQKAYADVDRRDYMVFSAGTLLTQMLMQHAIRVTPQLSTSSWEKKRLDSIVAFWPEGFIGVSYCVTVLDAIFHQEGMEPLKFQLSAYDLKAWWSFKENFDENPWIAVAFLDHFIGQHPNWSDPSIAASRPAMKLKTSTKTMMA